MAKILVADDDRVIRVTLRGFLEAGGHEVVDVADGKEASATLQNQVIDLLITDIIMPGQEGQEIILELRKESPDFPIIAISSNDFGQDVMLGGYLQLAKDFGANIAIKKPIDKTILLKAVDDLLSVPVAAACQ